MKEKDRTYSGVPVIRETRLRGGLDTPESFGVQRFDVKADNRGKEDFVELVELASSIMSTRYRPSPSNWLLKRSENVSDSLYRRVNQTNAGPCVQDV